MLADYSRSLDESLEHSRKFFGLLPKARLEVRRVPAFRELTSSAAYHLSEFHDAVLRNGPLPLDLLDEVVDAWIAELK